MGNATGVNDPSRVDILQNGCNGNMGWLFGASFPPSTYLDPRLAPYLTQEEHSRTIEKCNNTLKEAQRRSGSVCIVALVSMVVLGVAAMVLSSLHSPEIVECGVTSECPTSTLVDDAEASECCIWQCCEAEGAGCNRIDKTDETECECETVSQGKEEETHCNEVKISGPLDITPEENGWAQALAGALGACIALCFCFNIGQTVMGACNLKNAIRANFGEWQSKGLRVEYFGGSKHSAARICVWVPQPPGGAPVAQPAVVGAAAVYAPGTMQVAVPPGAGAGTALQVQAPTGQMVQVQVPPGVPEGGVFTVQY